MKLRFGPHCGTSYLSPLRGQIGVVLGLSPGADAKRGGFGAYYLACGKEWRFSRYVGPDADWSMLFWGEPEARLSEEARSWFGKMADAFWGKPEDSQCEGR